MTRNIAIALVLASACCGGCSRHLTPTTTLSSGKQVRITNIVPMHFSTGPAALILSCETDTPISDKVTLRKEVDEIWTTVFHKECEGANVAHGVIRISHPEGVLIKHAEGYGFAFEKRADGQWHCLEDDKK